MIDRLQSLEDRYNQINDFLCDPAIASDPAKLRQYGKEQSDLEEIVNAYREYKEVHAGLVDAKAMQDEKLDDEMRDLVKMEISELSEREQELKDRLTILLLPKDPLDDKNVIVELRGAVGGDEAALFATDLYKMYVAFAERQGWKTEVIDVSYTELGGYREMVFSISGKGAYSKFKFESGAHRVQRVPATDSGGRIHTSTATVAVLPEAEEVEVEIHDKDLRIDTFCSSGPGGQSVNTTQSAVRITHVPTGVVVSCQDEKSQIKNKDKAMKVLRARIFEMELQRQHAENAANRKSQVGTGDRSERIRTYNFPQSRVTDHRIGLTLHKLDYVLAGDLDEIINNLITFERTEALKAQTDEE
ncbi:peptide chain release factor 1 [Tumebacillus permanentifrigoris]|uniref:Peptide chain release factor 1 n=1 Tax=Tumebacillus permanentifrigoris TaxID=378543 RepID=A0A316DI49_9BACL|nr:peptide chain release factor 1 [Tumebacillus permanentifrigoris]PWK16293.1 peptide chain release factor 1 (bRF-1) [Tumebacillus permanentifrigoris]